MLRTDAPVDPRNATTDPRNAPVDPRNATADPRNATADPRATQVDPRVDPVDPRANRELLSQLLSQLVSQLVSQVGSWHPSSRLQAGLSADVSPPGLDAAVNPAGRNRPTVRLPGFQCTIINDTIDGHHNRPPSRGGLPAHSPWFRLYTAAVPALSRRLRPYTAASSGPPPLTAMQPALPFIWLPRNTRSGDIILFAPLSAYHLNPRQRMIHRASICLRRRGPGRRRHLYQGGATNSRRPVLPSRSPSC